MDRLFATFFGILIIAFGIFIAMLIYVGPIGRYTEASGTIQPSTDKSLILAFPSTVDLSDVAAHGTVSVFLRTSDERPVPNKRVKISTTHGIVKAREVRTTDDGKAETIITATEPGLAKIDVLVDNIPIGNDVTILFK